MALAQATTVTCTAAGGSSSGLTSTTAGGVSVNCWNSDDVGTDPPDVAVVAAPARVAGEVGAGTPAVDVTAPARKVATAFARIVASDRIAAAGELSVAGGVSALGPNAWSLFR